MSEARASMGPHDVGGDRDGPIDPLDRGMRFWEKHANGLLMVIGCKHISTFDEMRRAREDLGDRYEQLGYFERQTEALATSLAERGLVAEDALRARMAEIATRFDVPLVTPPDHRNHDHAPFQEDDAAERPGEHQLMNLAMQEILEEQGLITADEVRQMIERFDSDYPRRGAKVVARAWADAGFKERLLQDARLAIEGEMGLDLEIQAHVIALENTPRVHNVIVCTLCSCYPRFLLGHPPTWYKSRSYRSRVVYEPRAVLREFGTVLPDDVEIRVHDSNADMRYIVIPMRPPGTEGWSAAELEGIISRDSLVGVSVPKA